MSCLLVLASVLLVAGNLDLKPLLWIVEAEVQPGFPDLCEVSAQGITSSGMFLQQCLLFCFQ